METPSRMSDRKTRSALLPRTRAGFTAVKYRWERLPKSCRDILCIVAVAALPGFLFVYGTDANNWVYGARQFYYGKSIYRPLFDTSPTNPKPIALYPYLPVFAMLNGVLMAPIEITNSLLGIPWDNPAAEYTRLLVVGVWGYIGILSLPTVTQSFFDDSRARIRAMVLVLAFPTLWLRAAHYGTDILVVLLALLGVLAVTRERWLLAGILVGLSTFKLTGVPFAGVLAGYALLAGGWTPFRNITIGGLLSQLPNAFYFIQFPADFFLFVRRRGALSYWSHDVTGLLLSPVNSAGLTEWYISTGFLFVLTAAVLVGITVAVWRSNLLLGFVVGFIATSFLVPAGEHRTLPFFVLLLVAAATHWESKPVRWGTVGMLTLIWYKELAPVFSSPDWIVPVYATYWQEVQGALLLITAGLLITLLRRQTTYTYHFTDPNEES